MTQTVAVDFDGVIHAYSKGWHDGTIYDEPLSGAIEGLKALQATYAVFVFTSRDAAQVCDWLEGRGVPATIDLPPDNVYQFWNSRKIVLVTNRKLPAVAYIDDRAIRFTDWASVPGQLRPESHGHPDGTKALYRVGRHVGRTIYRATDEADELVGIMDTRGLGELAVRGMNAVSSADPGSLTAYRMVELETVLDEVLRWFTERGHPGVPCVRSGWVTEERVAHWRAVLDRRPRP